MSSRFRFVPVLAVLLIVSGAIVPSGKGQFIISRTFVINYVIEPKQVDSVVNLFRNRLRVQDPDAGIIECQNVTRISLDGAKDFAVGAACTVRSRGNILSALICENSRSDTLLCAQSPAPARDEVIQFTERNCLPADSR